jgi:hypothetical protein
MDSKFRRFAAHCAKNFCVGSASSARSFDLNTFDGGIVNRASVISLLWNGSWAILIQGLNLPD